MRNGVIASLLVVALIAGLGVGTAFFPRTLTLTSTQKTTLTSIQTTTLTLIGSNKSYPLVTATAVSVQEYLVVATCTTVSGTPSIVYTYATGGITKVETTYPPNLPQQYLVTLVTASTLTAANATVLQESDTC